LLHNGKLLFWSYDPANHFQPNGANTGKAYLWDPGTRTGQYIDPPDNIWCGGQTILSDGRVFIAGGNLRYPDPNAAPGFTGYEGTLTTYTFNPSANSWTRQPDMAYGRWYPTVTQLSNNQAVITSGYDQYGSNTLNQTVEVFTPSSNRNGVGKITTLSSTSNHNPTGYYPFQYQLGSASMLQAGPEASNSFQLDPRTWNWSAAGNLLNAHRGYGAGVLFIDASVSPAAQRVVIMNGFNESGGFANNEWLDANNPLGGWQAFPNLVTSRHNANTVILPDGTLLTIGGNSGSDEYSNRLYTVELYSKPAGDPTGSWTQLSANASIPSAYHSSAILLPNATVLLSEDDLSTAFQAGTGATHRGQIYSPPYLFNGTRPRILSAPTTASVGAQISISADTNQISSAVLVAPGATTHANDMHQRFIKLPITANNSIISATLPASSTLVPPGYYMLFILNNNGVPSVAKFIKIS
jgi:hypothetical protein